MKFKKRLAVLLSAAMVMGMTVPAGATVLSTNVVPGSDSRVGHGEKEDHLDREVTNIILPTISDNAFDFTVDPERLVAATQGARFTAANQSIDQQSMDDGVFFLVSENTYASKTPAFDFENKSSFAIDLTVEVTAEHNNEATDLKLLSANAVNVNPAPEAGLYLGLKVGEDATAADAKPILYGTPAKTTISVDGIDTNFTVSWNQAEGYHNVEKDTLSTWKHGQFQIEGVATRGKDITDDTSAPSIKVTWSWKKYGGADPLNQVKISGSDIYVRVISSVIDSEKLTLVKVNGATVSDYTVNATTGVIKLAGLAPEEGKYKVEVTYDGVEYEGSDTK